MLPFTAAPPSDLAPSAAAFLRQGHMRYRQHDYPRAIEYYDRAIQAAPGNADAYYYRGQARRYAGDLDGAAADYTRAIELDPAYADAYYYRAMIRKRNSDFCGAIADYEWYLRVCEGLCAADRAEVEQSIRDLRRQAGA